MEKKYQGLANVLLFLLSQRFPRFKSSQFLCNNIRQWISVWIWRIEVASWSIVLFNYNVCDISLLHSSFFTSRIVVDCCIWQNCGLCKWCFPIHCKTMKCRLLVSLVHKAIACVAYLSSKFIDFKFWLFELSAPSSRLMRHFVIIESIK